jgi:hypothetical protein
MRPESNHSLGSDIKHNYFRTAFTSKWGHFPGCRRPEEDWGHFCYNSRVIPHHFHLIWIGKHFPFVNRLAVESLRQSNPGARITIHFQDPPSTPDWQALQGRVEFKPIDLGALLASLPASMSAVAPVLEKISSGYLAGRSNILRYLILYKEGGIYLDFDTLTVKDYRPLLNLPAFIGEEAVFKCDDDRVAGKIKPEIVPYGILFGMSYYLSYWNCRFLGDSTPMNALNRGLMKLWSARKLNNAVLACEAGNAFFARAIALVPETDASIKYALGPILMNRTWDENARNREHMRRLDSGHFYFIPPSQTYRFFYGPATALPESAHTLHWCSSNHKDLAASLTLENLGRESARPTLFHKLAYEVIRKGI